MYVRVFRGYVCEGIQLVYVEGILELVYVEGITGVRFAAACGHAEVVLLLLDALADTVLA